MANPYEIVLVDCGTVGWLAILRPAFGLVDLWRIGKHAPTREAAFESACKAWDTDATYNIRAFKRDEEIE